MRSAAAEKLYSVLLANMEEILDIVPSDDDQDQVLNILSQTSWYVQMWWCNQWIYANRKFLLMFEDRITFDTCALPHVVASNVCVQPLQAWFEGVLELRYFAIKACDVRIWLTLQCLLADK